MSITQNPPSTHRGIVEIGPTQLLINGKFQDARSSKTFPSIDPVTDEIIAQVAEGDKEDIELAVLSAHHALNKGPWSKMTARERGRLMFKWADLLEAHSEELARLESLDNGKAIKDSRGGDVPGAIECIRYFAGWADKIHGKTIPTAGPYLTYTSREPVGVCGLIIPWNYPMNMAAWKLGPALAAGCTTILKPAEQTPLTALYMGKLALEAGIPEGVLNVVPGFGPTAGAALVEHPMVQKIGFTGEASTASIIKAATSATMKRLSFELGGKSPNIFFEDVDLNDAVKGAFGAIYSNMGQNCCAGSRTFIQAGIYDEFAERFSKLAAGRKIGDNFHDDTEHGAQVDRAQYEKILRYIDEGKSQGAKCLVGGNSPFERGCFVAPTVFAEVTDSMTIAREEIFGPVACLIRFETMDEVIERANETVFGLAAGVWTKDINKAHQVASKLKAGTVWINCYNMVDPAAPFGGFKMSGLGRDLGEQAFEAYTETKTTTVHIPVG